MFETGLGRILDPMAGLETMAGRIAYIREALLDLGQDELARRLGVTRGAVGNWELGGGVSRRNVLELAKLANTTVDWIETGRGEAPGAGAPAQPPTSYRAPPEFLSSDDPLRVFSAAEGGQGEIVVSTEPIDLVPRPWYVKNVRDAYAVLVVGDSMIPAFKPGQMAIVNPKLPVLPGDEAIFVRGEEHGEFVATIKELVRPKADAWSVKQWNPEKTFDLAKQQWPKALKVVGKHNR